jgi:hypothetical protein
VLLAVAALACRWQRGTTHARSTNWKFVATGGLLIEVGGLCRRTLVVVDLLAGAISQTLNKLENSFYGWQYERVPACRGLRRGSRCERLM